MTEPTIVIDRAEREARKSQMFGIVYGLMSTPAERQAASDYIDGRTNERPHIENKSGREIFSALAENAIGHTPVTVSSGGFYGLVQVPDGYTLERSSQAPLGYYIWLIFDGTDEETRTKLGEIVPSLANGAFGQWVAHVPNPRATSHNTLPWSECIGSHFPSAQLAFDAVLAH